MTKDHNIFQDQLAEYLADGLTPDGRTALEAHLDTCAICKQTLSDLKQLESDMTALFASTQPDAQFESRLVSRLRLSSSMTIHPLVRKASVAVAASVLLGGFGYIANQRINSGTMPVFSIGASQSDRVVDASNLRQVSQSLATPVESASTQPTAAGVAVAPTSTGKQDWLFGGGANSQLGWSDFDGKDAKANLYSFRGRDSDQAPDFNITQNNAPKQTALDAKAASATREDRSGGIAGRLGVELQTKPSSGVARDNLYFRQTAAQETTLGIKVTEAKPSADPSVRTPALGQSDAMGRFATDKEAVAGNPIANEEPAQLEALKLDRPEVALALQDAQAQAANPPAPPAQGNQAVETAQSKIIRNGEVEFEVDSFDSAAATVAKIVIEESGYIGTTNSEKLPNGKVRGTLVIRVKPDHLDTLVLKLRGLGELKKQNLTANDVTKQYYDIASELRAAHAMQERLLEIIKTGNAQVKDLLNVEKELATWRGKIEKLEGEIRYYDSLVSLSTLTISLQERDIRTASAIKETEQADAGIEVADVETARTSAIKAVEEAKGRIIEAELKKFDAGQFAAKVVADVPSDAAGAVIDRLKQIGKVARLEITRKQTTPDNTAPLPGAKIEKGDTRIIASFYNLANIAPRQTVTMQLACDNVAKTYADVLSQIEKAGGRVVTSNLQQPQPDQTSGTIQFELPTSVADASLMQIQQAGTSLQLTVSENPDTANVTAAKRGFNLSLIAADAIPARQGVNISAEVSDVIATTGSIQTAAETLGGKIVDTNQSTTSNNGSRGTLRIELPSAKLSELLGKIESTTKVRSQQSRVRADIPNSPTARAQVELNLATPETLVASDSGFGASLRKGFATSAAGLLWSLQLIVIGLCLVGPWVVLLWAGMKFWKRKRTTSAA